MNLPPEHEIEIRSKVNPLYRDQRGTESHERATLLGEIDRLRAEVAAAVAYNRNLQDAIEAYRAEIAEDRKYRDAMAAECSAMIRLNGEQLATIEALRKQNAKNEDDAARYRWLRKSRPVFMATGFFGNGCSQNVDDAESIIDAALAKDSSHE